MCFVAVARMTAVGTVFAINRRCRDVARSLSFALSFWLALGVLFNLSLRLSGVLGSVPNLGGLLRYGAAVSVACSVVLLLVWLSGKRERYLTILATGYTLSGAAQIAVLSEHLRWTLWVLVCADVIYAIWLIKSIRR